MPFLNEITAFINSTLKAGSLNKEVLQPAKFYGITSVVVRKNTKQNITEQLPAIITANGKAHPVTPDSKTAIQIYHKLVSNAYSYVKKSYGDGNDIKCSSEMAMLVLTNSKITGRTKDVIEPVVLFGMPQKLSTALSADLKINSCLITPIASNMDHLQVFRQEFPQSAYFLNEQMSIFQIRYKIDANFSQACVDLCLCSKDPVIGEFTNEFADEFLVDA